MKRIQLFQMTHGIVMKIFIKIGWKENQPPKTSIHKMSKKWVKIDFENEPNDINLSKERFVPYFSDKVPGSPIMTELYWDMHDDLIDPNRYDMGTEAHPGDIIEGPEVTSNGTSISTRIELRTSCLLAVILEEVIIIHTFHQNIFIFVKK